MTYYSALLLWRIGETRRRQLARPADNIICIIMMDEKLVLFLALKYVLVQHQNAQPNSYWTKWTRFSQAGSENLLSPNVCKGFCNRYLLSLSRSLVSSQLAPMNEWMTVCLNMEATTVVYKTRSILFSMAKSTFAWTSFPERDPKKGSPKKSEARSEESNQIVWNHQQMQMLNY